MPADAKNYAAMSVPHDSIDLAEKAYGAFFEEVAEARKKHRIKDVVLIACVCFAEGENQNEAMLSGYLGSALMALPLTAQAFGTMKAEQEQTINQLASNRGKRRA